MSIFELKHVESVVGKQSFYLLLIDGFSPAEIFMRHVRENGQYEVELDGIFQCMDRVANLQRLPSTKFRAFKEGKTKSFELKSKHLRFYGIHQNGTGKVIIIGGFKKTQAADLKKLKLIRTRYINACKA